jgi:hypothetical protein
MEPKIVSGKSLGGSLTGSGEPREWNWVPMALAVVLIGGVVTAGLTLGGRGKHGAGGEDLTSLSATPDPYAENLPLTKLTMSESSNLAGGKVTYLDGHIANTGDRTVTEVIVQVIFRNAAREVAQSERMSLMLVRMREPYIDTVRVSALPLKPGAEQDFRLNFDAVTPEWNSATPEVRILHVESR